MLNDGFDTLEMLAFSLKLLSKKSKKNVLISAGRLSDKERMLPAIRKLVTELPVALYCTHGTSAFLAERGVENQLIYKIAEGSEPNIKSFLDQDRFDFVINVLTGNNNYDESTDSNLIRTLAIEHGIPLITDVDVAILTIDQLVKRQRV